MPSLIFWLYAKPEILEPRLDARVDTMIKVWKVLNRISSPLDINAASDPDGACKRTFTSTRYRPPVTRSSGLFTERLHWLYYRHIPIYRCAVVFLSLKVKFTEMVVHH